MITGSQIRMARGCLKWSTKKLAQESDVGVSTVRRMEAIDGVPSSSGKNLVAVQKSLETAGIVFVDADSLGPGVRLQRKRPVTHEMPRLKLGMWVKVGNVEGIVCQVYQGGAKRIAEIAYDQNGVRFVRDDIYWFGGRWEFATGGPSGGYAEQDPLLSRYIAELRERR